MTDTDRARKSQATELVEIAQSIVDLGMADDGQPYATYPDVPHVALPLRGGKLGLRHALARTYFERHKHAATSQALTDAMAVLEGFAALESPRPVHLRVAERESSVYIDMADSLDRVIVIRDGGWRIEHHAPVLFRRTEITAEIPDPIPGGDLDALWRFVTVDREDRPIVLAALVSALVQPEVPHVILALLAEHGSAKSSATRVLADLIDPSPAPVRSAPRDASDWLFAARTSWVIPLDNISHIPQWFSDALCTASTGDGYMRRRLYTDDGVVVTRFRRVVILNGIDLGALRGDLADRLATVTLRRISDGTRVGETELTRRWQHERPHILGALLDLAAQAHKRLADGVTVPGGVPRMADYARTLYVVDELLGTDGMDRYRDRRERLAADSISGDVFISHLVAGRYRFDDATSAQILADLTPSDPGWRRPRDWPATPRAVTTQLTRHAPALRMRGWKVEHDSGRNKANATRWTIEPPDDGGNPDSPNSPNSPTTSDLRKQGESGASQSAGNNSPAPADTLAASYAASQASYIMGDNSPQNMPLTSGDESGEPASQKSGLHLASRPRSAASETTPAPDTHSTDTDTPPEPHPQQTDEHSADPEGDAVPDHDAALAIVIEGLPGAKVIKTEPGQRVRDQRYRSGLCADCGERPYAPGRLRCDPCHATYERVMRGYER